MIVGYDISQTGRLKAGCGHFAEGVIRHLARLDADTRYVLYPTFGDGVWDPDWPTSTLQIRQPNVQRGAGQRLFSDLQTFWRCADGTQLERKLGNPDVVHSNNFFCPTGLRRARVVYTLYDLGFLLHPEWTNEANRLTCFTGVFNASVHADHVVCISQYTRTHLLETFPHFPAERSSVVYPASRFTNRLSSPRPTRLDRLRLDGFWLSVGTLEPRKNQARLLRAYARLKASHGVALPLVLAGGKGWLMEEFDRLVVDTGLERDVLVLGYASDAELQWLYEHCFAFVYPSLFEGFGMPVVEAMSLGAVIVTSNTSSLPEVVGDAAILVDPIDEDAILSGLLRLSEGSVNREALRSRARDAAKRFSWNAAAEAIRSTYRDVVASPKRST